jgi:integrase
MRGKGEGTIFQDKRGLWTAQIELPPVDGERRRATVRRKRKEDLLAEMRKMQNELDRVGDLPTSTVTVEQWLRIWFDTIHVEKIRPKTAATYQTLIRFHILPAIGSVKLDKLTAAHVRRMHAAVTDKGLSSTTASQCHRILVKALNDAVRDGRVGRNVATLTDAPRKAATAVQALSAGEGIKVLQQAATDDLAALWAAVLLTGARQGELLGLELNRVSNVLDLSWQLQRFSWSHGCDGKCPKIRGTDCPARTIKFPADFEHRHITGGLWWSRPKSRAGWRVIPLVEPLESIIRKQVEIVTSRPNPHGLLFTMPDGSPIDPRAMNHRWHALLDHAGVTDVRLHDGRHTAVDLLYAARIDEDLIMQIVGHSVRSVTRGYKSRGDDPRLWEAMRSFSKMLEA